MTSTEQGPAAAKGAPWFLTRGVVLLVRDMETLDWPRTNELERGWPARAKKAGLSTIATHVRPSEIAGFVKTEAGQRFLAECRKERVHVEHELHALSDLLPRDLFAKDPAMFRMDEKQERVGDCNLCVHSKAAGDVVCENAIKYTKLLPATTGRYFYWLDDGRPMCRCPKCKELSDSDQALLLENQMLRAIRTVVPDASLAHLSYHNTLPAPSKITPEPGVFLEFAPIERAYDRPISQREGKCERHKLSHGELLDHLDANLAVFGARGAQALEYWLDVSRFSYWKRDKTAALSWHQDVYLDDLCAYAQRGIRHVTSFACWIDGDYVRRFGDPPLSEYGRGMLRWFDVDGGPREA
jgi:hypothetical protein